MADVISPGNIVIPLSSILDQLKGKLSASEIDALLTALVSKKKTDVHPGDLITAELMNQILADVADLQIRVTNIELGATIDGPPVIDHLEPSDALHMGDELTVVGRNLKIANLVSVKLASTPIINFKAAKSNDNALVFDIPAILGINPPGALVALEVTNTKGGPVSKSLFLMPSQTTQLNASFGFTVIPPASPLPAGGSRDYTFSISAITSADETYLVVPSIDTGWSATPNQAEVFFPKSTTTPSTASVVVTVGAPASGSATLKLELRAKHYANKSYFSQNVPVAVGSSGGGTNPDFTLTSTEVFPGSAYVGGKIKCASNQTRNVTLSVTLAKTGTYLISATATAPWTRTVQNDPNPITTTAANQSVDALVDVVGPSSTIPAGTTGKLTITYQRQAPTTDSASFEYDIIPS